MSFSSILFVLGLGLSACQPDSYREKQIRIVVVTPSPQMAQMEPLKKSLPKNRKPLSPKKPSKPKTSPIKASPKPTPTLVSPTPSPTESPKPIDVHALWKDVLTLLEGKHLNRKDLEYLFPSTQNMETRLSQPEVDEVAADLYEVHRKLKNFKLVDSFLVDKYTRTDILLRDSNLSPEVYSQANEQMEQIFNLIKEKHLEPANEQLNEIQNQVVK